MRKFILYSCIYAIVFFTACKDPVTSPLTIHTYPPIYPDYIGVTIPSTIAPMNFTCPDSLFEWMDIRIKNQQGTELHVNGRHPHFPEKTWKKLLSNAIGDSLSIIVSLKKDGQWCTYKPFSMYVSPYPIDYGLTYRKIAPSYVVYSKMGIYERDLSSFKEKALLENTLVKGMCLNCHTTNHTSTDQITFHIRGTHGATFLRSEGKDEYLNTQTDKTISTFTYPYWHPDGKYIAYSTNTTRQSFQVAPDKRIEVIDQESDIVVYHLKDHTVLLCDSLCKPDQLETFPAFSPDGHQLYFCSAKSRKVPEEYKEIRYNLCCIAFDPINGTFGNQIDTLVNAEKMNKSISFPRPSYDGRYLMFTMSDYGNFSIWHKEADLWLLDLRDRNIRRLDEANSDNTDSFHNWSSNSRWFVFSSRREDGLYTRLYLASMDENGNISKPFLLPQKDPKTYYDRSMYSYNVPDFIDKPINLSPRAFEKRITSTERTQVTIK